jgi:hypothetical protein
MKNTFYTSIINGIAASLVIAMLFFIAEPTLSNGATTQSTFTISQTVTAEIAFGTPASNIILSPSLGGLTGGTANGGTQVNVKTNNHLGYQMTIAASSSLGMLGNTNPSNYIPALVTTVAGIPDFTFNSGSVPSNRAYFGYTAEASTTSDLATNFKDNGSTCGGAGSSDAADSCWISATSTSYTVVNRATATPGSGSTTTLKFRVVINANPSPSIPDDTYVATTTLTATTN